MRQRKVNTKYYCKHCGKTMNRDSKKAWVKSYCEKAGKTVHLVKVGKFAGKKKLKVPKHIKIYS